MVACEVALLPASLTSVVRALATLIPGVVTVWLSLAAAAFSCAETLGSMLLCG